MWAVGVEEEMNRRRKRWRGVRRQEGMGTRHLDHTLVSLALTALSAP